MLIEILVAMVATLSFAVLFHIPPRQYVFCAVTGAVGWVVYRLFIEQFGSLTLAAFVATLVLALLSRGLSVARRVPSTVFLIAGIFPLVPGAGIYYTVYHLIMNETQLASFKGLETIKIAGAIVLGILFGFSIPQFFFQKLAVLSGDSARK